MLYGGLEAGGTKMICVIGNENGEILERATFPTLSPEETMPKMLEFFKGKDIKALGIACFGPIDLNKESSTYGYITTTPKKLWANYDIVGEFKKALNVPIGFDTDVNGSLLGEITWGCAKGKTDALYITIGTGVGGGIIVDGKLLKGKSGSAGEMHFKMSREKKRKCTCGAWDCFEIYTSGKGLTLTVEELTGKKLTTYEIVEFVQKGDKEIISAFDKWEEDISSGFIGLGNIFDPDCIILSGSMAEFLNEKKIEDTVNSEISTQPLKILKASSGNYSGMIGAALLTFEKIR